MDGFDWGLLRGKNSIGLNAAIKLGPEFVKLGFFGDADWFDANKWMLEGASASMQIATLLYQDHFLRRCNVPWLRVCERIQTGFGTGRKVAWNFSTGAAAINLAINLGSARVFLLGFDMSRDRNGRSHWHRSYNHVTQDGSFAHFMKGFSILAGSLGALPASRPVNIINVVRGDSSRLDVFEKMEMNDFANMIKRQSPLLHRLEAA